jgi:peptidoglycan/LPS O-acetylase OafA/YrhL
MAGRRTYLPGLNGVRVLAALAVLVDHVEQDKDWLGISNQYGNTLVAVGRQGVELFFVLSGFLITYLMLVEEEKEGRVSIPRFYARRALRIWPLYFVTMGIVFALIPRIIQYMPAVVGGASANDSPTMLEDVDPRIVLYALFCPHVSYWIYPHPLAGSHLWSIGVEEQFYLAWPLLLRWVKKRRVLLFVSIIVAKLVVQELFTDLYMVSERLFAITEDGLYFGYEYCKQIHFEAMAIGALGAYLAFHREARLRAFFASPLARAAAYLALPAGFGLHIYNYWMWGNALLTAAPAPLYAFFLLGVTHAPRPAALLENRVARSVGDLTYGVYMLHPFVLLLVLSAIERAGLLGDTFVFHVLFYVLAVAATLGSAWLSRRFIEAPMLALKDARFGRPQAARAAASPEPGG